MRQVLHTFRVRAVEFTASEDGPTATEYAILLAMIILGSMGVIQTIGADFQNIYTAIANSLPNA